MMQNDARKPLICEMYLKLFNLANINTDLFIAKIGQEAISLKKNAELDI